MILYRKKYRKKWEYLITTHLKNATGLHLFIDNLYVISPIIVSVNEHCFFSWQFLAIVSHINLFMSILRCSNHIRLKINLLTLNLFKLLKKTIVN